MKRLFLLFASTAFVVLSTSSQATLLMYEPFDYPAGQRLGGSGTSPLGQTNSNGQQWITRSPASITPYDTNRDVLITVGNLSYPGLATSVGNSVRYGSSVAQNPPLYTDAIAIPGSPYLSDSVYYSMIVRFHSEVLSSASRTSFASLSEDPADPSVDAGYGLPTSSGTVYALPAGAWIRRSGTTDYQFGAGKSNTDGMGTSAGWPSWQSGATPYPNQQGNIPGSGQAWTTIEDNTYFIVMKYTYVGSPGGNDDTVSMWVNPIPSTLGDDAGEVPAGETGGSYYSATNAYVTAALDATYYGIQSFILIANAQESSRTDKTIDVSVDEIRIGTTWADVTPVPPVPPQITAITNAGTTSVTVTWTNVQIGTNYVLQYSTNLSSTNWTDLAPVTAVGTTASQTDNPPSGDAVRFYRVLKQ